jgi:DNA-binding MltR family transcriptional regulator
MSPISQKQTLDQLYRDTPKMLNALKRGTDLACVLTGSSYLEELLANMLEIRFIKSSIAKQLLHPYGVLGTFKARADLSYCLGLINKSTYQDLCQIAEVRNQFAHSHIEINFGDSDIQKECEEINAWRIPGFGHMTPPTKATQRELRTRARGLFMMSIGVLITRIGEDILKLREGSKLTYPAWGGK